MQNARVKTIVASLIILGAGLFLFFTLRGPAPPFNPRPHEGVGYVLAEEAGKLASGGGRVLIIARDTSVFPNLATDAELKGFQRAARKLKLNVTATNFIRLDPLRLVRVPPGDFFELMRRRGEGDVIVSLLGPPLLSPEQIGKLSSRPQVVAFCPGPLSTEVDLRGLFDRGLLQAAVVSRSTVPLTQPTTSDPRAWFDRYYQLLTPLDAVESPVSREARTQ